ncbi:hypothetical protein [Croceiramulus getboli]|nr:hypothetical protein P8624_06675 [Flavobacteriaceae bacterium YJPT1-3]
MRTFLLLLLILGCGSMGLAQTTTHQINGQTYELQTEVSGPLTLLWNTIQGEYVYFIEKDGQYYELKNTRVDGTYQNEYRDELQRITADANLEVNKVNLTPVSLRKFVNAYNRKVDPNYITNSKTTSMEYRLGVFGGMTNSIFTENAENTLNPQLGIDLEILDEQLLQRHAVVLQYKQTLATSEFDYQAYQLGLNHRFKFVHKTGFDVYLNTKLVTYTYSKATRLRPVQCVTEPCPELPVERSGGTLQAPVIFGLGADIKLGQGFLMLNYHDAFAIALDDNGEFPLDFSLGYKWIL